MGRIIKTGFLLGWLVPVVVLAGQPHAEKSGRYELTFTSDRAYDNPLQIQKTLEVIFISPSGKEKTVRGFWDGGLIWKTRFMPNETGVWSFTTLFSDSRNKGLHRRKGTFNCVESSKKHAIYQHGPVRTGEGHYHLSHADGTPFFWLGCTAWNGPLKATEDEWETYLRHRASHDYSVIQFVTTPWRGCQENSEGLTAFQGRDTIVINPAFFRRLDDRIDQINANGLVAAPVLLWAFPGRGRELNPGYFLPDDQAVLLARYMVARYGANHVVWLLGGDGDYTGKYEHRWKTIGRDVFGDGKFQGPVALHPKGGSWIGEAYTDETWLDIIGYQSGHGHNESITRGITQGPVATKWKQVPAKPLINLEPVYDEIRPALTGDVIRKACFRSVFSAPVSGITYGANGIWPWLRQKGEKIVNHGDAPWTSSWRQSLELPASRQMGYLARFFKALPWWEFRPAQDLLASQPGDQEADQFVSVLRTPDNHIILVYFPAGLPVEIKKPAKHRYSAKWFNPATNQYTAGSVHDKGAVVAVTPPSGSDIVLVLETPGL